MPETRNLKSIVDAVSIKESVKGGYKSFKISPSLEGGGSAWYSCFNAKINDAVQKDNWYNFVLTQSGNYWNITKADKTEGFKEKREESEPAESIDKRTQSIVIQTFGKAALNSQGMIYQGRAHEVDFLEWMNRVKQITEEMIQLYNELMENLNDTQ